MKVVYRDYFCTNFSDADEGRIYRLMNTMTSYSLYACVPHDVFMRETITLRKRALAYRAARPEGQRHFLSDKSPN